jgi:uncharacterized cupredoxin-like copper-binding protein
MLEGEYVVRPELATVRVGQTYVFAVGNAGTLAHEFVIEPAGCAEAVALEAEFGGEERKAELGWTFAEPGDFQVACHLLDHYQAGLVVQVEVVT